MASFASVHRLALNCLATVSVLFLTRPLAGQTSSALPRAAPGEARALSTTEPIRLMDLGFRPLFSFPDAIGVNLELHPMGGRFAVEAGVAAQLLETVGFNLAAKYRFPLLQRQRLSFSLGPGIGSHWLFDNPRGGYLAELVGVFAASEAIWWGKYAGFRLALDLGVTTAVVDKHYYGRHYGTYAVVNSSVGVAFRLPP